MTDPTFSLVVPVHDVEPYLPEFLRSLERQTIDPRAVEVVVVDDGSTDRSGAIVEAWARGRSNVRVLHQANAGLCVARNVGLAEVRAPWVSFPDPDDVLHPQYLERVAAALAEADAGDVVLAVTNLVFYDDATGLLRDRHPLRHRFHGGDRIVDLDASPRHIHLSGPSGFFRTDLIRAAALAFDPRVRPNFEDAHFTARYLVRAPSTRTAVVATAEYYYRKRQTEDSLVQRSWQSPDKYTTLLRHGHLAALEEAAAHLGRVPAWLQRTVLYDLFLYYKTDASMSAATGTIEADVAAEFHRLVAQIMAHLDVEVIERYAVTDPAPELRAALLARFKGVGARPTEAHVDKVDRQQGLARVVYRFAGELPRERFLSDGVEVTPVHAKVRAIELFRQRYLSERIVWLPVDGALEVELDGSSLPLTSKPPTLQRFVTRPDVLVGHPIDRTGETLAAALERDVSPDPPPSRSPRPAAPAPPPPAPRRTSLIRRVRSTAGTARRRARAAAAALRPGPVPPPTSPPPRPRSGAWLLMDRDTQANDNAEHLYRYLQRERPDVDAWFVLRDDSPDWARLDGDGFRLLAFGSDAHRAAMRRAAHLISAQVDDYVLRPFGRAHARGYRFRFTFLAHGVAKQDVSRWLNRKPIDLLTTTSPAEHRSIVDDDTPYVFTTKEVQLTGMPRHDALWRHDASLPVERRDLVLVAPSWRRRLVGPTRGSTNAREPRPDFWSSEYARRWLEVLGSEVLHHRLDELGLRLGFAPHPNLEMYLTDSPLPAHVEVLLGSQVDFWAVLASARVVVTDYSSVAFDAALIERPVVYFQFDPDVAYGEGHYFRPGYFSYERDGFGPVTSTAQEAVAAIEAALRAGPGPVEPYRSRMAAAFAHRDGRASARVVAAIEALDRPARGSADHRLSQGT